MSRYIDADALKESLMETLDYAKAWKKESERVGNNEVQIFAERAIVDFTECILRLNNAHTIDAVEVVRCKDCKWYGRADKRRFYRGMDCLQKRIDTIVPDKDFCSRAERREE